MTNKPSLDDLERAVEEAWAAFKPRSISDEVNGRRSMTNDEATVLLAAMRAWLAARKEARKSGRRTVVLSQKTRCAIREWDTFRFTAANESLKRRVFDLVIEDVLGTVLQEDDR